MPRPQAPFPSSPFRQPTGSSARLGLGAPALAFAELQGFDAKAGQTSAVPGADGRVAAVLWGTGNGDKPADPFAPARVAQLPDGLYRLDGFSGDLTLAAVGFVLATYRFDRYRSKPSAKSVRLVVPDGVDGEAVSADRRRGRPSAATSSTRPPTTSGPPSWKASCAAGRRSSARP